jgi:hypothetical protein
LTLKGVPCVKEADAADPDLLEDRELELEVDEELLCAADDEVSGLTESGPPMK